MRKFWALGITSALLLVALALPPLSGASKTDKRDKRGVSAPAKIKQGSADAGVSAQTYEAVNFGVSRPVRELAAAQPTLPAGQAAAQGIKDKKEIIERKRAFNTGGQKELKRVEAEQKVREKNFTNKKIIRKSDPDAPGTPDAAIARVPSGKSDLAPQVMPTPLVSFEAMSLTDTVAIGQGFLPPDTVGEVGPNHYVQMVNSAFRIYGKTGTPLIPLTSIGALFSTIPGPCANNEDGDPIVMYDQLADRWILSEFCVSVANPNNHQLIAVSQTGDPTGAYYLYDFMMPNNKFNDYPHFGVWSNSYLMTNNQFNQAGTQFLGAGVYAFDRTKMLAGDPTAGYVYFDKAEGCPAACQFGGMLPTDIDGFVPPPAGTPASIMQFDANEFGATDSLRIFDFNVDFATPANSTLTERAGSPLAVAAFDPREVPAGSRNVVPQPPPGVALDAISDRLMFRLAYRNYGTHESIAAVHSVNAAVNPVFRAGVRYYEIRKTGNTAWAVQEQGTMSGAVGDTEHRWMGSTAMNGSGSQAVGYSVSSATVFPSIRYAGRLATDPAGSLAQGEATLVAGTSSQTHSSGRWGDYSDLTVDPVDDCTFWFTTLYVTGAAAPDNTRWHTRIGSFQFGPCAPVQKGILDGAITSSLGGAPIPNATISAGPFIRTSGAGGVYNIDPMGTGTYTVSVSAPGYTTAVVPGVVITQGGTTTQNVQLTPQTLLQGGTPAITAESCAVANGAPDPGETITINLPIVNNGGAGATTSNLVATLQATGGISSPSGPQNYGAVLQGAAAVVRPFTFTVSASCGQLLNLTLQLQDGATNLGNLVYNIRVGTLGAGSSALYSTGNIATPIPDVSQVEIPIVISALGAVGDVNARVRLNHTFDADVTMTLISPAGTEVVLAANRDTAAGGGDNYGTGANDCSGTPTVFDDAAANAISTGLPPFAGSFKPESPLAAFNGETITGTWKLRVSDNAALDVGTVGCVTLEITRQPFVCCGVAGTAIVGSGGAAAVTAESFNPANNAPDPGETITATFPLVNTGDGHTSNLIATLQATGGVTPITPTVNYGIVTAGGAAVSMPLTFITNGACGSNITVSLQLQDGAINLGTVTYTMRLGTISASTQTFSNSTAIVIPGTGTGASTGSPANPYPSNITVAGITNPVSAVRVTLKQITHTFPADVDVLLVGPSGRKFVLMSDVIGGTDFAGQTYTFDDAAAAGIPSSGAPPATGSFRPTNIGTGDAFPAPAPAAPYLNPATAGADTLASAFAGQTANGTWSLYVVDDAGTDIGTIAGGWDLTLVSSQNVCQTATGGGSSLIISEFRVRGPSGANDEYVELYNKSDSPITVSVTDASTGWAVAASDGVIRFVVPVGTVIPARGHYLGTNSIAYSLAGYATGDATWTTDIPDNAGLALFNTSTLVNLVLANRLDAVGPTSEVNTLYKEGTGYAALTPFSIDYSFYRNLINGTPQDTGDNAADFLFVDTNGTSAGAGQRLGAPGPENLSSPILRNATVKAGLIDPAAASSAPPNRVRDFTSDPPNNSTFGTLDIRRKFTNNTGASVTRLRFRVVDITTFPSPSGTADLRTRTSTPVVVTISGSPVTVQGTTLEQPPSQPNGGGFNSTLSAGTVTLATPLAAGASINVRFLLGIQQTGSFRFFINVEALP